MQSRQTLTVSLLVSRLKQNQTVALQRQITGRWVTVAVTHHPIARLRWRVTVPPAPQELRVVVLRGRTVISRSAAQVVLVYVRARVLPRRRTTLSADGYALRVPAGTVSAATYATLTPLAAVTSGLPGPAVRFHIARGWKGGGKRVRVTVPVDPLGRALGPGFVPVLVHLLDGGGGQILYGRALGVAHGEMSYESPSLSVFTSFSLPKLSLSSIKHATVNALADLFGNDLSSFLSEHAGRPICEPDDTANSALGTAGSAFTDAEAIDYQPVLKDCATVSGNTATWTLVNNTGATLLVGIDDTAVAGNGVHVGSLTSSGNPLLDAVFGKIDSSVDPGADGSTPQTLLLPAGAGVKVLVARGSKASLQVDEQPLGTIIGYAFSQVGSVAKVPGAVVNAVEQCGYAPARLGGSGLGLLQCLVSSASLTKLAPKVIETIGKVLLIASADITLKQALGIGHRTGSLAFSGSAGTGGGTGGGTPSGATPPATAPGWSAVSVPDVPGAVYDSLGGVSCAAPGTCMAVGTTQSSSSFSSSSQAPMALMSAAAGTSGWTLSNPADPAGGGSFGAVSCTSAKACIAVGSAGTAPLAERWNGSSWTVTSTPAPSGASSDFSGVSCTSAGSCLAVGQTLPNGSETTSAFAESWDGATWTQVPVTVPPGDSSPFFASVDCVAASDCYAVGAYGGSANVVQVGQALAEHWNGSGWTNEPVPNVPGGQDSGLSSISCASAVACEAVGFTNSGTDPHSTPLSAAWNGTSWSVSPMADPGVSFPNGVSCPSAGSCEAVGNTYMQNGSPSELALAEQLSGEAWSTQSPSNPGAAGNRLNTVVCMTTTACIAVGESNASSSTSQNLIQSFAP